MEEAGQLLISNKSEHPLPSTRLTTLRIHPVGTACNLDCRQCLHHELQGPGALPRIDTGIVEDLIRKAAAHAPDHLTFIWTGGEPTLAGLDFYREVSSLQKRHGQGLLMANILRTNGTALDHDWMEFLRRAGWLVELGLDGPRHIHEAYRTQDSGNSPHAAAERAARLLLANQVAVSAVVKVTDRVSGYPDAVYEYLRRLGFHFFQFEPVPYLRGDDSGKTRAIHLPPEAYLAFWLGILQVWRDDQRDGIPDAEVKFFMDIQAHHHQQTSPPGSATLALSIGPDGGIYASDRELWEDKRVTTLVPGMDPSEFTTLLEQAAQVTRPQMGEPCRDCSWQTLCRGLISNSFDPDSELDYPDIYCKSRQRFLEITARYWSAQGSSQSP